MIGNKKARHPVGLFRIWCVRYNSCRTCILRCCLFLFLSGASCSLCPHDKKLIKNGIDAKHLNECAPKRTSLVTFYPKSCPQKLGIISELWPLRNQEKMQKRMFFDQFYWLKVTVLLKKKPTCFQVGWTRTFQRVWITIRYWS